MGVDARIFVTVKKESELNEFSWYSSNPRYRDNDLDYYEVTEYEGRHYCKYYRRGNWPNICRVLIGLLACKEVVNTYYLTDLDPIDGPEFFKEPTVTPVTLELITDLTKDYIEHMRGLQ